MTLKPMIYTKKYVHRLYAFSSVHKEARFVYFWQSAFNYKFILPHCTF